MENSVGWASRIDERTVAKGRVAIPPSSSEKKTLTPVKLMGVGTRERAARGLCERAISPFSTPTLPSILYIGEAYRRTTPSGARFGQHVSPTCTSGRDPGTNYTLSQYYHSGIAMRLTVYEASDKRARMKAEKDLLMLHLKQFGALPIAQGTTGEQKTVHAVRAHRGAISKNVRARHFDN